MHLADCRVLEKRVHELRNSTWEKEQEVDQLKRLLKTKNDRCEAIELVQKTKSQLEAVLEDRNLEVHKLQSEKAALETSLLTIQSMYNRVLSQNSELRDSNEQLRKLLLNAQQYSTYMHNEFLKHKLAMPPPIPTEVFTSPDEGSTTPRLTVQAPDASQHQPNKSQQL